MLSCAQSRAQPTDLDPAVVSNLLVRAENLVKLLLVDDPRQLLTSTWIESSLPARTHNPNAQPTKSLPLQIFEIHALGLVVQRLYSVPFVWFGLVNSQ